MSQKSAYEWVERFCGRGLSLATDFIFPSPKFFNSDGELLK
jgi:hypothetical protein